MCGLAGVFYLTYALLPRATQEFGGHYMTTCEDDSLNASFLQSPRSTSNFANVPIVENLTDYSSHFCSGGSSPEVFWSSKFESIDWTQRSCVFRSLVWNGRDSFVYYFDPSRKGVWDFEKGSGRPIAGGDMNTTLIGRMLYGVKFTFVAGPIPANVSADPSIPASDNQSAYILAIPAEVGNYDNIGHVLGDFVWPLFCRMAQMRMLSVNNVFLYHLPPPHPSNRPIIGHAFLQALTTRPLQRLSDHVRPTRYHLLHAGRSHPFVKTGKSPFLSGILGALVKEQAFRVMNLFEPLPQNNRPKIAIRLKPRRHRILNAEILANHLKNRYPGAEVVAFAAENFKRDSLDELRFMSTLDVYITPEGGGSFTLTYMRDGATAILANPCWPGSQNIPPSNGVQYHQETGDTVHCVRVENFIWDTLPHIHKLYYAPLERTPEAAGIVVDAEKRHGSFPQFDYSYPVKMDQMEALVDAALRQSGFAAHAIGSGGFL